MKRRPLLGLAGSLSLLIACIYFGSPIESYAFKKEVDPTVIASVKSDNLQEDDINRFTNAISQIKDYYVQSTNDKKLLEDAIRGMLSGLDPHSEYLDKDSYKTLLVATSGEFAGLGVEVTGEFGVLKVISPIDGTPASKAGVKSGDYIVAINNKLVDEMTLNEAVDSMRGKKDTQVVLTVIRKGEKEPMRFKLTRDIIRLVSVKSKMLSNGLGYIRISQFQEPTAPLVTTEINKLKKQNGGSLKGLVLDLRNNPGGLLETAVQVSNIFLDKASLNNKYNNLIVYTEGRLPSAQYSAKATGNDILEGAPMVLLVNEGSASASEIVAGALQDYHRAVVVGTTTFGKGSVQTVLPLDDAHAIKLTTALYHTPSGRTIQNKGVIPDVVVENLKVAANNQVDTSMLGPIHEFDLKGHIKGQDTDNTITDGQNNLSELAKTDFQLYQAANVLKTMAMLHQNQGILVGTVHH